jgi:hypothetical protein
VKKLITAALAVGLCAVAAGTTLATQQATQVTPVPPAVRGRLDSIPDRYLEIGKAFAARQLKEISSVVNPALKTTTRRPAIYPADVQWRKNVLTVAFNGGDPQAYALIETTAQEWAAHSSNFKFDFRTADGSFRQWAASDVEIAADIRIAFQSGPSGGYWSLLGRMAEVADPGEATINFEGFPEDLRPYQGAGQTAAWLSSYYHSVVLHELGHALGLSHEHFHPDCQADLKMQADPGYVKTVTQTGEYGPDGRGRSPGALLYFEGYPNNWTQETATFNLNASEYFQYTVTHLTDVPGLVTDGSVISTPQIDPKSVMLYAFPPYLFKSGLASKCVSRGDGPLGPDERFATKLSDGDIAYFLRYYGSAFRP